MTAHTTTARSAKRTRHTYLRIAALTLVVTVAAAMSAGPVLGAKPDKNTGGGLTGNIELAGDAALRSAPSAMTYGSTVAFDATVSGKMAPSGYVHVMVVCEQAGNVVYQWSSRDLDFAFPLVDQTGDGLEWNGDAADCSGWLVYRDGKKRNPTILYLDHTDFAVSGN